MVGNCGISLAPRTAVTGAVLAAYVERLFPPIPWAWHSFGELLLAADAATYVTNYAPLVGHGTIRLAVMGMANRSPNSQELGQMKAFTEEAVAAGAFGLSSWSRLSARHVRCR